MYSLFPATELLNSLLFSDIDDDSMTEALEPLFLEDGPMEQLGSVALDEPDYSNAFRSPSSDNPLCVDPALIFSPATSSPMILDLSDSDTESEPSTPFVRRSTRFLQLPKVDYTEEISGKQTARAASRRRRLRSLAGPIKNEHVPFNFVSSLRPSKSRVRSPKNVAASEQRRKRPTKYFCGFEGCNSKGFTAAHNLKKHMNMHSGLRTFCNFCSYSTFYDDLPRHVALRH